MNSFPKASRYCFQLKKQAKERERQEKKEARAKEQQTRAQAREKIKMSKDKEKLLKKVCLFILYFILFYLPYKRSTFKEITVISMQKIDRKMAREHENHRACKLVQDD